MPSHPPSVIAKAEAAVETAKKSEQEIQKLVSSPEKLKGNLRVVVLRYIPSFVTKLAARVGKWWHAERIHRVAEASLPNRKMDGLAIDGVQLRPALLKLLIVAHSPMLTYVRVAHRRLIWCRST